MFVAVPTKGDCPWHGVWTCLILWLTLRPRFEAWENVKARMFSPEKLRVYDRALACVASLAQLLGCWDKRHAVVDQLLRASESVLLNLVEAARLRASGQRQHVLDYAIGRQSGSLRGPQPTDGRTEPGTESGGDRPGGADRDNGTRVVLPLINLVPGLERCPRNATKDKV
jgi:hypothetical protein